VFARLRHLIVRSATCALLVLLGASLVGIHLHHDHGAGGLGHGAPGHDHGHAHLHEHEHDLDLDDLLFGDEADGGHADEDGDDLVLHLHPADVMTVAEPPRVAATADGARLQRPIPRVLLPEDAPRGVDPRPIVRGT